jgi:hypothetical protein
MLQPFLSALSLLPAIASSRPYASALVASISILHSQPPVRRRFALSRASAGLRGRLEAPLRRRLLQDLAPFQPENG